MRVVITGHTGGLGLAFFNYFTSRGDEVIGLSRSNGYLLPEKIYDVIDIGQSADIFINNCHSGNSQTVLLSGLYNKVSTITCGSMASDHPAKEYLDYAVSKKLLETTFKKLKKNSKFPMLFLKMGFLENWKQYDSIPYQQVVNAVDFWLKNPRASIVEFDNINYETNFTK